MSFSERDLMQYFKGESREVKRYILDSVRDVLMARGGHAVIIAAPPDIARHVDMASRRDLF